MASCEHEAAEGPCEKQAKFIISLVEKDSALLPNDMITVQTIAKIMPVLPKSMLETGVSRYR